MPHNTLRSLVLASLVCLAGGASVAVAHGSVTYAGPAGLATTNGNKAILDTATNILHVAFSSGGGIRYSKFE
jgi:hypothetical protein